MKKLVMTVIVLTVCATMSAISQVQADTLEMKDGRLIDGKYMGGTQNSLRFQTEGKIKVFRVSDVLALTFSDIGASSSSSQQQTSQVAKPEPATPTPAAPLKTGTVTIPPGTKVAVRMLDSITVAGSRESEWFKGVLDEDLTVDGTVIIPEGTRVNGQVVTAKQDRSGTTLAITLREMMVAEKIIPIATHNYVVQEEQAKNALDLGIATLKVVTRDKPAAGIPYRSVVEFETSEPLNFRLKK